MPDANQLSLVQPADIWQPPLFPKQFEVFNARERYLLVTGPRVSGKTIAVLHRIVRHAWEVNHARIAIFAKTIKSAKAAGPWAELTDSVIPVWQAANLGSPYADFEYTKEEISEGATRMFFLRLRNYWGGESEIQLHSLKSDKEVEKKLLGTSYSLIYFSELQEFEDPAVFNVSQAQLRKFGVAYEDQMWIADTNPPESGPDHFAYDLWFTQIEQKDHPYPDEQRKYRRIEFTIDDNLSLDAKKIIQGLKNTYKDDPEGWQRFIEGKWTRSAGHAGKHFSMLFKKNVHIIGEANPSREPSDWEVLNPSEKCQELFGGWDIGHSNHSFHIVERTFNEDGKPVWWILDEVVSIAEQVTVEEFGWAALEQIESIEKYMGRELDWIHWSDTSAFRHQSHGTDEIDAATIYRISEGRIVFRWAARAKAAGTVRKRVEYLKRLLRENRLFVSAHCFKTVQMFNELRKGPTRDRRYYERDFIARGDENKHPFDSLSYIIYSEMLEDLESEPDSTPDVGPRSIMVPLG